MIFTRKISLFFSVVNCCIFTIMALIANANIPTTTATQEVTQNDLIENVSELPTVSIDGTFSTKWKGRIRETRDTYGRLVDVKTLSGVTHQFSYDDTGRLTHMQDGVGNLTIAIYKTRESSELAGVYRMYALSNLLGGTVGNYKSFGTGSEIDPSTGGDLLEFYRSQGFLCAIVCLGIVDSINNFVGNLANWLGVGASVGATLGAIEGIVSGATAAQILTSAGLGTLVGTAVVIAFAGGWVIGTGVNGVINHIVYKDGRVVVI